MNSVARAIRLVQRILKRATTVAVNRRHNHHTAVQDGTLLDGEEPERAVRMPLLQSILRRQSKVHIDFVVNVSNHLMHRLTEHGHALEGVLDGVLHAVALQHLLQEKNEIHWGCGFVAL